MARRVAVSKYRVVFQKGAFVAPRFSNTALRFSKYRIAIQSARCVKVVAHRPPVGAGSSRFPAKIPPPAPISNRGALFRIPRRVRVRGGAGLRRATRHPTPQRYDNSIKMLHQPRKYFPQIHYMECVKGSLPNPRRGSVRGAKAFDGVGGGIFAVPREDSPARSIHASNRASNRAAARRLATNARARRHANSQSPDSQSHNGRAAQPTRRAQRCLSVGFRPRRAREIRFGVARAPANPRNRIFIPRASAPSPRGLKPPS